MSRPTRSTRSRQLFAALSCGALMILASTAPVRAAEPATRLADLRSGSGSGVPTVAAAVFGGKLYFRGTDDGVEYDLWVYDGGGTPTVVAGGAGIDPLDPVVWEGKLWFRGVDEAGDAELWSYDGINPPSVAVDLRSAASGNPRILAPFGSKLCFWVSTPTGFGPGCWQPGMTPVSFTVAPGFAPDPPESLVPFGDELLFAGYDGASVRLYRFDGANAPTAVLADATHPGGVSEIVIAEGVAYFVGSAAGANGARLWQWNGVDAPVAFGPANLSFAWSMTLYRGRPHLHAASGSYSLWRVDTDGVTLLAPAALNGGSSRRATVAGASLFLIESGGETYLNDLHEYCGLEAIPQATTSFEVPYQDGVLGDRPIEFGGRLYFAAFDATAGTELWSIPLTTLHCDGFVDGDLASWSSAAQ